MFALAYTSKKEYRPMGTALFVNSFSIMLSLSPKASDKELSWLWQLMLLFSLFFYCSDEW
jgi:hypothetical protein